LKVDELGTLRAAREAARSGNPVEQTLGAFLRRFRPDDVQLRMTYNHAGLAGILDGWQREAASGGVEGNLRFEGTNVVEIEPQRGLGIDRDDAQSRLLAELRDPDREPVVLPVGVVAPQISRAEVTRTAAEARALLTGPHEVDAKGVKVTISPEQLVTALGTRAVAHDLQLTVDSARLRAALGPALAPSEQAPVEASFQVTPANTVQVVPSVNGHQVDLDEVGRQMLAGNRHIVATVREVVPPHDTAWAQSLGIKEQVSTFTTRHNAGEDRVKNIHRAADILNNTVVEPGATFSLNNTIGPRTAERGFVVAPVFYGGFTEDVGGGVSQLATTTFNAVFFGGYEDVYHKPHSIYITRYPMGREATVNYPTVDLKFKNDSHAGILIRTSYTATSITVTFYGDKEGKTVTEDGRKVLGETPITNENVNCPAPADVDTTGACAHLTAGQTKLAQEGHKGIDVEFYRVITRPGQEPVRQRFFWRYRMYPNKYLVGTAAPTTPPTAPTTAPTAPVATTPTAPPPSTP
jgi:vancomycin resistance protein YoaR